MNKLLLLLVIAVPLLASAQSVYRWVDKDGKVSYSDSPPPADVKNVQQKQLGSGASVNVNPDNMPAAVKAAVERNPVTAYLTNCGALCDGARLLLSKRGIPYTVRDPEKNPADAEALTKLVGGLEVPLLQVGERTVKGFDEGGWNSALDGGGYPRFNPFTKAPDPKQSPMPKAAPAAPATPPAAAATPPAGTPGK